MAAKSCASCTRRGTEHREAGGPARHDVGVVAENGQGVGGDGARRDVHREGSQLSRDLEHVGDHQEQALRRREGRRQGAGLQRAVHRSRGARLRLHLDDVRDVAPEVPPALIRPFVGELAHRRRGRDGINRDHFAHAVRDRRRRFVAVHRHRAPLGHTCLSGVSGSRSGAWNTAHAQTNNATKTRPMTQRMAMPHIASASGRTCEASLNGYSRVCSSERELSIQGRRQRQRFVINTPGRCRRQALNTFHRPLRPTPRPALR